MKTRLTELLNIEYPVMQGAMAWISDGKLAAAVGNGGGIGFIAASSSPIEYVEEQIRIAKSLTDKPFGVNIMLMSPTAPEVAELVIREKIPVITTGAGNPSKYMERWKEAGIKVIPVVASCALARKVEKLGADAVVAEGCESGGHVGEMNTMALVPQVVDSVQIPVIAAGGIADGRGMAAAFMLGACGVQMGSRFVMTEECKAHPAYKEKILKAIDTDTMVTGKTIGHPVRAIKNRMVRQFREMEESGAPKEELEKLATGGLRRAAVEGDMVTGSVMVGQVAGMLKDIRPAADVIRDICEDAEKLLNGGIRL